MFDTHYTEVVHKLADFKIGGRRQHHLVCGEKLTTAIASDGCSGTYNWSRTWRPVNCLRCNEYRAPVSYKFWRAEKRDEIIT